MTLSLLTLLLSAGALASPAPALAAPGVQPDFFTQVRTDVMTPTVVTGDVLTNDSGEGLGLTEVVVTESGLANSCGKSLFLHTDPPEVSWTPSGTVTARFADQWPSGLPAFCMGRMVKLAYTVVDTTGATARGVAVLLEEMPSGGYSNPTVVATEDFVMVRTRGAVSVDLLANDVVPPGTTVVAAGTAPSLTTMTTTLQGGLLWLDNSGMTPDFSGAAEAAYVVRSPDGQLAIGKVRLSYEPPLPMLYVAASLFNVCSGCYAPILGEVKSRFRITSIRVVPGTTYQVAPSKHPWSAPVDPAKGFALSQPDVSLAWNGDNTVQPALTFPALDRNGPMDCPRGEVEQQVLLDIDIESIKGDYLPRTYRIEYQRYHELGSWRCPRSAAPAPATLSPTKTPTLKGAARVGQRVKVNAGTWPVNTTAKYRWFKGDSEIRGARGTKRSLLLVDSYKGSRVRVRITVSAPGTQPYVAILRLPGKVR